MNDKENKNLFRYTIIGFIFVSILGSLAHFFYEWSGYSFFVGLFSAVNESTWEHLKLLFFPYLFWSVVEYFILGKPKSLFPAKAIGVISGMAAIVIFFYSYTGIFGKSIDFLNILSFFIGVAISFAIDYQLIKNGKFNNNAGLATGIAVLISLCVFFILFTVFPIKIPLFKDPISSTYGI